MHREEKTRNGIHGLPRFCKRNDFGNGHGLQEYIRPVEGLAYFLPHGPDGDSHADPSW